MRGKILEMHNLSTGVWADRTMAEDTKKASPHVTGATLGGRALINSNSQTQKRQDYATAPVTSTFGELATMLPSPTWERSRVGRWEASNPPSW